MKEKTISHHAMTLLQLSAFINTGVFQNICLKGVIGMRLVQKLILFKNVHI